MKRKNIWKQEVCDTCRFKTWMMEKEWNFTIQDHLPITMRCPHHDDGKTGIIRGTIACYRWKKEF